MCDCLFKHNWFLSNHSWETFDHIHASLQSECVDLHFYANWVKTAILDQIGKLFVVHQLQVLCYCCITLNLIHFKDGLEMADYIGTCPIADGLMTTGGQTIDYGCLMVAIAPRFAKKGKFRINEKNIWGQTNNFHSSKTFFLPTIYLFRMIKIFLFLKNCFSSKIIYIFFTCP